MFNKLNPWPSSNILLITGSRGKTTVSKSILRALKKNKLFKKVIYLDRKKITFSNVPKYQKNVFLIAEVDYQLLAITKEIRSKYRIITSFFSNENKAFKSKKLYLKAKLNIFKNIRSNEFVLLSNQTYQKLGKSIKIYKKKIILFKSDRLIKNNNSDLTKLILTILKKNFNDKN